MKLVKIAFIAALFSLTIACKKKDDAASAPKTADPAAGAPTPTATDPAPPTPTTPTPTTPTAMTPTPAAPAGTAPAPAVTPFASVDEAGAAALVLAEKVAAAVSSAGGDCAKIAASLSTLAPEFKVASERSKSIENDPAKRQEFAEKYEKPAMAKLGSTMQALQACQNSPEVQAFMQSM